MDPIPLRKRKSDEPVCGPSRKPDSPVKYESDSSREFDEELLANWNFLETEHISQPSTLSWSDVNIEVAAEEEISTTFGLVPTVSYSRAGLMSLPREILQLIFSHLPLNHLSLNVSLSCKYLYEVINDKEFLKWQKRYCRYRSCKENSLEAFQLTSSYLNAAQIVDVETSVVRAIMSARNFRPEPPTPAVMQIESAWRLHQLAAATLRMLSRPPFTTEDLTEENVCLDTQSGPNLWTKLAGLLLLCDDVASVMQLFRLVSSLAPTEMQSLKEVAYYMATLFTAAYRQFHISSRHSYTLHHSLFLLENSKSPGVKLTSEQMRVVDYRLKPNDLVRIIAYAGTGKTTTLVEYCKWDWEDSLSICLGSSS